MRLSLLSRVVLLMGANFNHDEPDDNHSKPNRLRPFTHIHAHLVAVLALKQEGRTKYKTQTFLNVDQKQQEAGRRKQQQQRAVLEISSTCTLQQSIGSLSIVTASTAPTTTANSRIATIVPTARKRSSLFRVFSRCSSRACLGKMIVYI